MLLFVPLVLKYVDLTASFVVCPSHRSTNLSLKVHPFLNGYLFFNKGVTFFNEKNIIHTSCA